MKKGLLMKRVWIFSALFLLISINIVLAETTGDFNGSKLTIFNNSTFIQGTNYTIDFQTTSGSVRSYPTIAKENGTVEIESPELRSEQNGKVSVRGTNGIQITEKISIDNKNPYILPLQPILSPTQTISSPTQSPIKTDEKSNQTQVSFWTSIQFYIIIILFLISVITLIYLRKLEKRDEEVGKSLTQPQSNFYKLKIELIDESSIRLPDKIIKVTNKKGVPQSSARSNINGECILDLPKGTHIINIEGGDNFEDTKQDINLSNDSAIVITLTKKQPLEIAIVDESGNPACGINVRVKETSAGVDIKGSPVETDSSGIAKFYISKNKQYVVSVISLSGEFINQENIPLSSSETTKRIHLSKKAGTLEITVSEQATGKPFAGIPVSLTNKGTSQTIDFVTDNSGRINRKLSIGDYIIRLKPSNPPLYDPIEKQVTIIENRTSPVALGFKFNYQPKTEFLNSISKINEKLNSGFKEVSAYDTCIPLFFKTVGEKPLQLVERIIKRPVEFLDAKTDPAEIISYILDTADFVSNEISRVMTDKSNVDFYFLIQNLPVVNDLAVSDYSSEKLNKLVQDTPNYYKNHFREIGNKLLEIDGELTQLSGKLTIQPVADLWRIAQKLQENCNNEPEVKKRGVMLFITDKLLDHVREMYNNEEVKARLKFSML